MVLPNAFGLLEISLILSGVSLVLTGIGARLNYLTIIGISLALSAFFPNFWRLFVFSITGIVLGGAIFFKGGLDGGKPNGKKGSGTKKKKGKI